MTKLIDADALLAKLYSNFECLSKAETIAHIENAPTVQREGWKLVPIEPTWEMLNRASERTDVDSFSDIKEVWEAMLAASPPIRSE